MAVREISPKLFAFAIKLSKSKEDANDYVQESFARLWKNIHDVEFDKCKSWLFKTTYHLFLNNLKKEKRKDYNTDIQEIESYYSDESFENKDLINKTLSELSDIHKSIILLRDYEGYNYQEIGEILNLNESQVKVYLFRARKKFKDKIKGLLMWVA